MLFLAYKHVLIPLVTNSYYKNADDGTIILL